MIIVIDRTHIPECVQVIRKSFLTVAEEFGLTTENAPRFTAFATDENRLFYQLDVQQRLMVAWVDEDGKIIGFYSLIPQSDEECELGSLCVLPEHRHKNIGSRLLEDSFSRAKNAGFSQMKISIIEENSQLRQWYEGKGFVHTSTEKFDFFPFTCGYLRRKL
ncbi:MAG: GNAT family N-acetyltransferase [Ruminococcus sp.]|nr:GNAT family N-acetyltransferase [Ruminococcus sp.]MBQ3855406.1 GNAT family N-acetyltransferase [Ruminococcus sp.]